MGPLMGTSLALQQRSGRHSLLDAVSSEACNKASNKDSNRAGTGKEQGAAPLLAGLASAPCSASSTNMVARAVLAFAAGAASSAAVAHALRRRDNDTAGGSDVLACMLKHAGSTPHRRASTHAQRSARRTARCTPLLP